MTQTPQPGPGEPLRVDRPAWMRRAWLVLLVLVLLAVALWYATHPRPLTAPDLTLTVATPPEQAIYVGVVSRVEAGDRSITIREMQVNADHADAVIDAVVCRRGRIAVTSSPEAFCESLDEAVGATVDFADGDQLIMRIFAETPGSLEIDGLDVAFREGLQWGTQHTGPTVEVTILDRPAASEE